MNDQAKAQSAEWDRSAVAVHLAALTCWADVPWATPDLLPLLSVYHRDSPWEHTCLLRERHQYRSGNDLCSWQYTYKIYLWTMALLTPHIGCNHWTPKLSTFISYSGEYASYWDLQYIFHFLLIPQIDRMSLMYWGGMLFCGTNPYGLYYDREQEC